MKSADDLKLQELMATLNRALEVDILPKLRASAFAMVLVEPKLDALLLVQVGAAVLLDKPLILVALPGAWIPAKARQLADAVVTADSLDFMKTEAGQERMKTAVRTVMRKLEREKQKQ
jgi:hypothetical protein